jgi:RNA polymerase-binding transcription factor DksA
MPHKMTKSSGRADAKTATHASPRRSIVARATKAVAKTRKAIGKVAGRPERPDAKAPSSPAVAGRTPQPAPAKAAARAAGPARSAQKSATGAAPAAKRAAAKKVSSASKAVAKKVVPAKAVAVKAPAAKAPAKKAPAAKAPAKKAPAAKAPARKVPVAKVPAKKVPVAKAPAKKVPVAKAPAKKAPVAKAPAKKVPAKKSVAAGAKSPARGGSRTATKTAERPAQRAPGKVPAKAAARPAPVRAPRKGYTEERFLNHQRNVLERERATYLEQANSLQEEADLLVAEMEPGDIQFDEESGEGGTVAVDRERDLTLSAQALEGVVEIEAALAKIGSGKYGVCEGCGELIPKPRLEALPYARLCMACKSGGLSRR